METNLNRPIFLVLEGLDGSGKSSVAMELAKRLDAALLSTPLQSLREVRAQVDAVFSTNAVASTCWYAAHVSSASEQAAHYLEQGRSVVMDRYALTTMAYSAVDDCAAMLAPLAARWTIPSATIFLHPSFELRTARLQARGILMPHDQRYLTRPAEEDVIKKYLQLSKHPVAGRFYDFCVKENWSVSQIVDRILDLFFF